MGRQRAQMVNFQFNKGWNTEASPMTFPEGTAKDLSNVILDIDGSIRRRAGINFDKTTGSEFGSAVTATDAISYNTWDNVAGAGNFRFVVTQLSTTLYFHIENGVDTLTNYIGSIDFSSFATDLTKAQKSIVYVTSGMGYLFVTGDYISPFYCTYDVNTEALTATEIIIQIRDFDGIDEGTAVDLRPGTLSNDHLYNLRNQGWPASFPCDSGSDPVQRTKDVIGAYPSNADILAYGKTESADDAADIGKYNPNTLARNNFGTSPAPKGKYIYEAWNINRGSIVAGAQSETVPRRPKCCAFHNGRVFYAGINVVDYTGNVYFSQQLTKINKVGNCYQENDPTAEEFNELLATDGGVLTIPGAGGILQLLEGPNGIVVLASNGVWNIGGTDGKFNATDYSVTKITDIPCIGSETAVNADGIIMYWSESGIITLKGDQITGKLNAENITQATIQSGYLIIGGIQQSLARGRYIPEEKKVVWIYSTASAYDGVNNRFKYNGILVFDFQLGAFYKYDISDMPASTPYVAGVIAAKQFGYEAAQEEVTVGGSVVTASASAVTAGSAVASTSAVKLGTWKFLMVRQDYGNLFTMGGFRYLGFYDWYFVDGVGVDYSSYLETGYQF